MATIPADVLVNVVPSVVSAGGQALDIIGLVLTQNTRVPIGSVASFPNAAAVSNYFGPTTNEATIAGIYFAGFTGSDSLPLAILFTQFNTAAVGAYLRGGNISALPLATLQGYNGTLNVTIDGVLKSANVNLAAATSFSNAAEIIGNSLGIQAGQTASFNGSMGGTTLTVTSLISGSLAPGDVVAGTAGGFVAGTYILSQLTGSVGGTGTYLVSSSQTVATSPMTAFLPGCSYDSVSGAFTISSATTGSGSTISFADAGAIAGQLLLTQVTGAVLSQGAGANNLASIPGFMNAAIAVTTNWATFMTAFDPDTALATGSNTAKQAFAAWKNTQTNRFAYICPDTDASPTVSVPATSSLGFILANNGDSGTCVIYQPSDLHMAAFICGAAAAIDFEETNGRITFAYKWQAGLTAGVTSATVAADLLANGYNFGGAYGAANQNFVWFQNGQCTGVFKWLDSYINQIWLNNQFQLALLELLQNAKSIPYDSAGNNLIEAALSDPIQAGLNFGAYAPGSISASQIAQVNAAAGSNISQTLQTQGYYLQVLPATSIVREARGSPPINFWYLDRGSVQLMTMDSIAVV